MKISKTWYAMFVLLVLGALLIGGTLTALGQEEPPGNKVAALAPVTPKISVAVRDLPADLTVERTLNREEINPMKNPGLFMPDLGMTGTDTKIQDALAPVGVNSNRTPGPIFTFEGQGDFNQYTPPDTTGDVGPNHYIQMVNVSTAIYDKAGNLLSQFPNNALWAGFGGSCETMNDGDPIVLYDDLADRWLLSQFAVSGSPTYMCFAISTTPDPLGSYYLYAFSMPDFPDYPKLGVWPDGYYLGTNTGYSNQYYAHVFERDEMLVGGAAGHQYVGSQDNFLMPADVDGQTLPAAGEPGVFYTFFADDYSPPHPAGVDRLAVFEFDVDWTTPANSTFTLVNEMPVAPFNYTVCGFFAGDCIPQPGTTQHLDSVSPWPMVRLQYRNFGSYEAMVGNFTVDVDGTDWAGIRWFELRRNGGSWSLYQEGTYAPDSDHRFMGSAALDGSGNIALGYSVSSATTYPSIRYTVHETGDALGTMQAEAELWAGAGSNDGPYDRWGDYSSMVVDPVDNCTFWYTNEYHDTTESSFLWNTRIGYFTVPGCTGALGDTGTLDGTVTDASTTDPIENASIASTLNITQTYTTNTDANGDYVQTLPVGTYTVTASAFGYLPTTVSAVDVISGGITTQDFALTAAPSHLVYGYVTDTNTGWPLYASLDIDGYPGDAIWTDPVTGYYEISLPEGVAFTFDVNAWVSGYLPDSAAVGPLTTDTQVDFALDVDVATCVAPGYTVGVIGPFYDDFESGYGDWTLDGLWNPESESDTCGSMVAPFPSSSNAAYYGNDGTCNYDTGSANSGSLTMAYSVTVPAAAEFNFRSYEETECGGNCSYDNRYVQISTNNGATWTSLGEGDTEGAWYEGNFDLSSYAGQDVQIRFYFDSSDSIANNYFGWMVDNVAIGELVCDPPVDGGLVVGNVYDNNTMLGINGAMVAGPGGLMAETVETPADTNVDDGFYTLFSPSGTQTFTATMALYSDQVETPTVVDGDTVEQDFYLLSSYPMLDPTSLHETVDLGASATVPLTLTNIGDGLLDYEWIEQDGGYFPTFLATGTFEEPTYLVPAENASQSTSRGLNLPAAPVAAPLAAGDVIQTWVPSELGTAAWGIAFDDGNNSVWVSEGWGTYNVWEYAPDGTYTGRSWPYNWSPTNGPADLAYNWNTGLFWAMDVGGDDCIHEVDPASGVTGNTICPGFGTSQRGLAYDPVTDTYFAGSWNDLSIHHFAADGTILSSVNVGLSVSGLAYNPETMHLFVMVNAVPNDVYVLDAADNYNLVGQFSIPGFTDYSGAGLEFGCDGSLWAVDQNSDTVYQVESDETASLCGGDIPWLSEVPITGTLSSDSNLPATITFDAGAVGQPGVYYGTLKLKTDDPVNSPIAVPVTMTVNTPATFGLLEGVVTGLGYCDADPSALADSEVVITGSSGMSYTVMTDASGYYGWYLDEADSPYSIAVTADEHESGSAASVVVTAGMTTVQDFDLRWLQPCVSADPESFEQYVILGETVTQTLNIFNDGAFETTFEIGEINGGYSPLLLGAGGPDLFGYTYADSFETQGPDFDWVDIVASGTSVALSDDDSDGPFPIGFTFNFYGVDQTEFYVGSNGFISFGSGSTSLGNQCPLPNTSIPNDIIPLMWDDLDPGDTGDLVYYETFASCPVGDGACLVVQYENFHHYPGGGTIAGTFEGIIFENGNVLIQFEDAGDEEGLSSTTGLENYDGTDGLGYGTCNVTGHLQDSLAVCYAYPGNPTSCQAGEIPWLVEEPITGTVSADSMYTVDVGFHTEALTQTGWYSGELQVSTDDPVTDKLVIPVSMYVMTGTPGVEISADSVITGSPGTVVTHTFTVMNMGDLTDTIALEISGNTWETSAPENTGPLAPGDDFTFEVAVTIPLDPTGREAIIGSDVFTVDAISQFGSAYMDSATGTTLAGVEEVYTFEVSGDQMAFGAPGEVVTYTVMVTSTANVPDGHTMEASAHEWDMSMPPSMPPMDPGEMQVMEVTIMIPYNAGNGDSDSVTITMASEGDPSVTQTITLTTTAVVTDYMIYLPVVYK